MTGYLNGRPVSQVDELLIDQKMYSEADIKNMIKEHGLEPMKKGKKGKKK